MAKISFDAVIFDLDGVVTHTASVHSAAWKQMFDEYLRDRAAKTGERFQAFTHTDDYLPYVDGKPRYKGVANFLESRGIHLPYGDPSDQPDQETICGLGNRKNQLYNLRIAQGEVEVFLSTVALIKDLKSRGVKIGVASSSKNTKTVLDAAGLLNLFETRVDGVVSAELNLMGKPEPDIFTTACDQLGVPYDRAVIVEDAVSGVQAGKNGNFGLVIGIARENNALDLRRNGADLVIGDMAEITFDDLEAWFSEGLLEDQWTLSYEGYRQESEAHREALLTVGNGYFGTRGALEESNANEINYPGTYIAGVFNRLESLVAGRTVVNEDFVNCPNWSGMNFRIDDQDWFDPNTAKIIQFSRKLDFRDGILRKRMLVRDIDGRETLIETQRLASMAHPHLAAMKYSLTPLNYNGKITLRSALDGRIINAGVARYRQLGSTHLESETQGAEGGTSFLLTKTNQSGIRIAETAKLHCSREGEAIDPTLQHQMTSGAVHTEITCAAQEGQCISVEKLVGIYTSQESENPLESAKNALEIYTSFDEAAQSSAKAWKEIWDRIDVQIEGDRLAQKLLRLHLYHCYVTASPHTAQLDVGIPARGLHGEAYRGHIFWDELYILPIYNLHYPETARGALKYRYRRLDQAKAYAREHGYHGAMFPWQSGSDGREETQVLHLNPLSGEWGPDYSSLQRHVSLAIAYNIWEYFWITKDRDFLEKFGAETFLEICRFWDSKATFNQATERYDIDKVMGPDEYHEKLPGSDTGGLLNNSYTNLMVVWVFNRAFDILDELGSEAKQTITQNLQLTDGTLNRWKDICQRISLSISEEGILEQFAGYFGLEELDWEGYRKKYGGIGRLDRILKAEGKSPDDYKLAKQADTLMAFYNLPPEEVAGIIREAGYPVPANLLQVNFDYYIQRTSHGSTLSRLVHAYLAYLVGEQELGWELYMQALKSDYIDIQGGTTKEGIHTGVMAGTIVVALRAFAGVSLDDECLQIHPRLPGAWRSMQFGLGFKDSRYHIVVTPQKIEVKVTNPEDQPVTVIVEGKPNVLIPKKKETIQLRGERQDVR